MASREPPELRALLRQARNASKGGSEPRKHHLVPASYLQRWAVEDRVQVTDLDARHSYSVAPDKAARETDFYRIDHELIDPEETPPLLMETMLGWLEGSAKQAMDVLVQAQPSELSPKLYDEFAWHMALQTTRGRTFRAENHRMLNEMYRLQYRGVSDDQIKRRLEEHGVEATLEKVAEHRAFLNDLQSGDFEFQRQTPQEIGMAAQAATHVVELLAGRNWVVYDTRPCLVTCDEPVVPVAGPGAPRDERGGYGTAGVVLFPLSPDRLLAMFRPDMVPPTSLALDGVETAEVNLEILSATYRWAFETPQRAVTRQWVFPAGVAEMATEGPVDGWRGEGDLYRNFKRTRWAGTSVPWPVARWWAGQPVRWPGTQWW